MNSSPIFTGVRVSQSLAFCVEFCICTFFFGHCIVSPSIYGVWLPLWSSKDFWSGQIIWTKIVSTWAYGYKIVHTLTKYQVEFINNKRILLPKTLDSDLKAYMLKIETTSVTLSLILWVYGATFYIISDTISWKPFFIWGEP
jgi:hypothetical protein